MPYDAFLKLEGVKGESLDAKHKDEIQIESYSWGLSNVGDGHTGGGGSVGKAAFQDFTFTTDLSQAMPPLFTACASGKHIKEGLLTLRRAGDRGLEFLKIKFNDIIITGLAEAASTEGDTPMDQVSLSFAEIEIEYSKENGDGSVTPVTARWNLLENRA